MTPEAIRYRRAGDALWRVVGDRTYVTRADRSDFELLRGIGSQAWKALRAPVSADDLAPMLSFDAPVPNDPREAVAAMLNDLEFRGLLERA